MLYPISFDLVSTFYYYDELTPTAQAAARKNIMIPEQDAHDEKIAALSYFVSRCRLARLKRKAGHAKPGTESIHYLINDKMHIRRIINGSAALHKARKKGEAYIIPFIRSNRTIFTINGDYVYYDCQTKMIAMIIDEKHFHLNQEYNAVATPAYIDVNGRGPAYHDWLYRMHHRIKFFMIRS